MVPGSFDSILFVDDKMEKLKKYHESKTEKCWGKGKNCGCKYQKEADINPECYAAQIGIKVTLQNLFSGKQIDVVSAHMKSGGGKDTQTDTFKKSVEKLGTHVICGVDFNSKPDTVLKPKKSTESELTRFLKADTRTGKTPFKTAHKEITGIHLLSTFQRRCCGEQGDKIKTKTDKLFNHAKAIDHSFYRGLFPRGAMILKDPLEVAKRFNAGGLPAAANSSDHIYACIEYSMTKPTDGQTKSMQNYAKKYTAAYKEALNPTWWGKFKKWAPIALPVAAVTAAAATAPWWLPGTEDDDHENNNGNSTFMSKVTNNKVAVAAGVLTVVPALCYGGYKAYKHFTGKKNQEESASAEKSNGWFGSSKRSGKKKSKKDKEEKGMSGTMMIIIGVVALALLATVAFFMLSGSGQESEFPEGELPIGPDRV